MIGGAGVRIWLATAAVDGRKGFDTLCATVRQALGNDPLCGDLFIFRNRSMARVKILFWDGNGLVLYAKRLEKGTFRWPKPASPPSRSAAPNSWNFWRDGKWNRWQKNHCNIPMASAYDSSESWTTRPSWNFPT